MLDYSLACWATPGLLAYTQPVGLLPTFWTLDFSWPVGLLSAFWSNTCLFGYPWPVRLPLTCWAIPSLLGYPLTYWATPHHQPVGLSPGARIVVLLPTF